MFDPLLILVERQRFGQLNESELHQQISEITTRVTQVSLAELKQFGLIIPSFSIREISPSLEALQAAQSPVR